MTESQNIAELSKLSIDFIGFNFYVGSKRFVRELPDLSLLPASTQKVGIFVNESKDKVLEIVTKHQLDIAQLHGNESVAYCEQLKKLFLQNHQTKSMKIIKVFMVGTGFDFNECKAFEQHCNYFLFDTKGVDYGGNGEKFNWQILEQYSGNTPYLLAGGIQPEDAVAIKKLTSNPKMANCIGMDINSGFETEPGIKNIKLIQSFKQQLK